MKQISLFTIIILLISVVTISCNKDEPDEPSCVAPNILENVIGTWSVEADGDKPASTVVFNADGTGIDNTGMGVLSSDPCASLGEAEEVLESDFTWEEAFSITPEPIINITWSRSGCISNTDFQTVENECDRIVISHPFFLNTVKMNRQ